MLSFIMWPWLGRLIRRCTRSSIFEVKRSNVQVTGNENVKIVFALCMLWLATQVAERKLQRSRREQYWSRVERLLADSPVSHCNNCSDGSTTFTKSRHYAGEMFDSQGLQLLKAMRQANQCLRYSTEKWALYDSCVIVRDVIDIVSRLLISLHGLVTVIFWVFSLFVLLLCSSFYSWTVVVIVHCLNVVSMRVCCVVS